MAQFSYDYHVYKNISDLPLLASFLFLMSILYLAKRLFSKYRLMSFSVLWFFLTLLSESSFFSSDIIFEHRLYLPLAGYSMFLAGGLYYLWGKNTVPTMVAVLAMIVACNSVLTYQRNKIWKNEFTLWDDTIQKSPHKPRPYVCLGAAFAEEGNLTQALSNDDKAIAIDPGYADAYYNRGIVEDKQGHFTQALADYNKALELNPGDPDAYNNRAVTYYMLKNYDQAWEDAHKIADSGRAVNPKIIDLLKKASGRDK